MQAQLLNNVMGGLVQGENPVRVRIDNANIAYGIERIEMVEGVAYLIVDSADVHIVPVSDRDD